MSVHLTERRTTAMWGVVAMLSLVLAYGVAEDGRAVLAVGGLVALVVGVVVAADEPRWAVVALAFGSYATLIEAGQSATGLPLSKRLLVVAVAALIAWRRSACALRLPARRDVALVLLLLTVTAASAWS